MNPRSVLAPSLLLILALAPVAAAGPDAATAAENDREIVLRNGRLTLTLAKKSGDLTSIRCEKAGKEIELTNGKDGMYFDADGAGHFRPTNGAECRVVRDGPDFAEAVLTCKATPKFAFNTEVHYVLPRGESGFYAYVVYGRGPGMAAAGLGQTRFVVKGVHGTELFTHHVVDDRRKGPFPTAKVVETLQDATYRREDGTVYTKYDNSAYLADHRVHGMAGHGLGLWMIFPSNEFVGGGPVKQELTVHMENVVLGMLQGGHFGSGGLQFKEGEPWAKLFGPLFVYVNQGPSVDAMWDEAKKRADAEAAKWPYAWLEHEDYPRERGTVSGRVRLTDGGDTKGAWVILAPPGEDWTQSSKGYDFWTRAGIGGTFSLAGVRPGRYTLFVSGADQFEDFRREGVEVGPGKETDLGELKWGPVKHGARLWQIGVADRTSAEFKGGDNYRHYGNYLRYPKEFPDDVTFVVGKSKEADDWNFAQWSWYNKKPYWTIQFDLDSAPKGAATLTLGFASAQPAKGGRTNLRVKVNGREVSVVRLAKSGAAGYRSGCQDSAYNVAAVPFDAGLLRKEANEITLGHAEAAPFPGPGERKPPLGEVMYDAIRLEVDPAAAPKAAPDPAPSARLPTLFIIGDSTVNNRTKGLLGWGDPIADFFDKTKVGVENRARGGRSSRTYQTEGLWDQVVADLKPGDFVLMQFGHNDNGPVGGEHARASLKGNGEETREITDDAGKKEVVHTYGWYMRKYVADARAKGATPIVLSPVPRNMWGDDGKVLRAANDYGKWAAEAAKAGGAAFIDLNELVARRYEAAGPEKVKALYFGEDHTHTTPAGARLNAEAVVEGLKSLKDCPLCRYLSAAAGDDKPAAEPAK